MAIPTTTTVYGKILPKQAQSLVNSKVNKLSGFKYPIDVAPFRGYFPKQSGHNLIKGMLNTLIRTERGERFMLPDYGCSMRKYLMEPLDETTFNLIRKEVQTSIKKYLRQIDLKKIQIFPGTPSFGFTNVLNVKLFCSVKDEENNNLDISIKI